MTPEEIMQAYEVVAQDVRDKTAQEAATIGNAQRSLGTLAERVASPSGQTSGLANYTYNRLLRPTVDTTTAALITQGKAQALQTDLTNKLLAAKQKYENARNAYQVASTSPSNNNVTKEQTDGTASIEKIPNTSAGTVIGVQTWGESFDPNVPGIGKRYEVIVADGKGGQTTYAYAANSAEGALSQHYKRFGQPAGSSGGFSGGGTNLNPDTSKNGGW